MRRCCRTRRGARNRWPSRQREDGDLCTAGFCAPCPSCRWDGCGGRIRGRLCHPGRHRLRRHPLRHTARGQITAPIQAGNAIRSARPARHPYQWGGTCTNPHGNNARDRCDCSSLMQHAYGVAGIEITRTTCTQLHDGWAVPVKALQPGDLVFTNGTASRPEHVAMFIGDGLVVHAPRPGRVVEVAELATHGMILVARRVAP
ncbi:C40 family peptidase [Streptomyces sp. NPDC051664]|uniref:C40 family peptidase n=1 Tax=Streptomyces sp. NPDC051664 TaxID=3365668 RepID=UPI0037941316